MAKLLPLALIVTLLAACATSPFEQEPYKTFITTSSIQTAQFKHRVLFIDDTSTEKKTHKPNNTQKNKLSIFIEGDGSPWYQERYVKRDPSPSTLLLFEAMQSIKGDKLYLGRPCYFQTNDPNCHYRYWTSHRYSREVIQSLREVINEYSKNYQELVFVGHSGGGTLATLLACSPPEAPAPEEPIKASTLITLSANLDTDKWTDHHAWSRMSGSLNPTAMLKPCPQLSQYHYVGEEDTNVPYVLNQGYFKQHGVLPIIYESANHHNWLRFWPDIVKANPSLN